MQSLRDLAVPIPAAPTVPPLASAAAPMPMQQSHELTTNAASSSPSCAKLQIATGAARGPLHVPCSTAGPHPYSWLLGHCGSNLAAIKHSVPTFVHRHVLLVQTIEYLDRYCGAVAPERASACTAFVAAAMVDAAGNSDGELDAVEAFEGLINSLKATKRLRLQYVWCRQVHAACPVCASRVSWSWHDSFIAVAARRKPEKEKRPAPEPSKDSSRPKRKKSGAQVCQLQAACCTVPRGVRCAHSVVRSCRRRHTGTGAEWQRCSGRAGGGARREAHLRPSGSSRHLCRALWQVCWRPSALQPHLESVIVVVTRVART